MPIKWPYCHIGWSLDSNHPPICDAGCVSLNTKIQFADLSRIFLLQFVRRPSVSRAVNFRRLLCVRLYFFFPSLFYFLTIFGRIQARRSAWHNDRGKTDRAWVFRDVNNLASRDIRDSLVAKGSNVQSSNLLVGGGKKKKTQNKTLSYCISFFVFNIQRDGIGVARVQRGGKVRDPPRKNRHFFVVE